MREAFFYSWALLVYFCSVPTDKLCVSLEIRVPVNYTALSGDLEVHVLDVAARYTHLDLLESGPHGWSLMAFVPLPTQKPELPPPPPPPPPPLPQPPSANTSHESQVTVVKFPCGLITQGGKYGVRLRTDERDLVGSNSLPSVYDSSTQVSHFSTARLPGDDATNSQDGEVVELQVRWPGASLTLDPQQIQTYPETPVTATLMFQAPQCEPAIDSLVPETWFDLLYCGHTAVGCTHANSTHRQLLYSEQVRGYPQLRVIHLECNLFGLAGHYALALRTDMHFPGPIIASSREDASLKAEWSEKFVFNVHARSIFPCDAHGGGVSVLFQYPSCILPVGDKVRVFARQRIDVLALVPPSVLEYVTEQKIVKGKHSLLFDCELFTEKYVEYCFVYVSQALTGAVSDVRMDCVPTFPVSEGDSGQWGPWSEWTPCSTTCLGGTRNRYRFCDNPAPRYGAKFCEGHALETEQCGHGSGWECQLFIGQGLPPAIPADRAEIRAEIGPGCRCGCVIHLGVGKPRRLLASSSQSCPGRTFWLVQADRSQVVMLLLEHFRLTCPSQWLKVRDGDSLSSRLLTVLSGTPLQLDPIVSTGPFLLLEFFSDEIVATGEECWGGFLAHAVQKDPRTALVSPSVNVSIVPRLSSYLNELYISHLFAATLFAVVTTASLCLLAQYLRRYSKYQRAAAVEEMATDYSEGDEKRGGLIGGKGAQSRAASTSTLLSEVMSLHRLPRTNKHKRLEEDETEINDPPKNKPVKRPAPQQVLEVACKPPLSHSVPKQIHKPSSNMSINSYLKNSGKIKEADVSPLSSTSQIDSKAKKDKKNWERMIAGSELSLTGGDTDLEMDYYDYNVQNASAVPGSYLGMDPAFCVWIPPFAPGKWNDSKLQGPSKSDLDSNTDSESSVQSDSSKTRNSALEDSTLKLAGKKRDGQKYFCNKLIAASPIQVHQAFIIKEKETKVEKSPSEKTITCVSGDEEEIKFVDEDEDELEESEELIKNEAKEIPKPTNVTLSTHL